MRVSCIAFTERGYALAVRTAHALSDCAQTGEDDPGWDVSVSRGFGEGKADLRAWTALAWEASDALLFVGAAGIAVRAIAPHVASKATDSAVVAIDEAGRFAVPLLSGHLGGANELAQTVARAAGAIPRHHHGDRRPRRVGGGYVGALCGARRFESRGHQASVGAAAFGRARGALFRHADFGTAA